MALTRVYTIHLRTLLAATAAPLFLAVWWWGATIGTHPALAPTETVGGMRVVIDPGHGGVDPGAVGHTGVLEKDIVLDIALKLVPLFNRVTIHTVLIRDGDVDLGGGVGTLREQKRTDLAQRVDLANQSGADIYISLHANSFPSSRWSGAQTFYYPGKSEGEELAVAIQSELLKIDPLNNRQARPGEYYVLERTTMPAVVVEVGFISNPREEELLQDPDYQGAIAEAIFQGVVRYILQRASDANAGEPAVSTTPAAGQGPDEGRLWVTAESPPGGEEFLLYFKSGNHTSDGLAALIAPFPDEIARGSLIDKMRYAVESLLMGPAAESALLPTAPPGAKVLELAFDDGTVRVDLSEEVGALFWGGALSEGLLVESLVRTLGQFPGVEAVAIEVEGKSEGTLAGHVDISRPFKVVRSERP